VLEASFVVDTSPAEVYRLLMDARRTCDWAVLPGCPVVEPAVVTSKTPSGATTGQLIKAKTAQGHYVACHFRTNKTLEGEFVRTTAHLCILSAEVTAAPTLSPVAARDDCLSHFSMTYVSDWKLQEHDQVRGPCAACKSLIHLICRAHDISVCYRCLCLC
jgi:hypothetical protein